MARRKSTVASLNIPQQAHGLSGTLTIAVLTASNLQAIPGGAGPPSCDPYVTIRAYGNDGPCSSKSKTSVRKRSLEPTWNEMITIDDVVQAEGLHVAVKHHQRMKAPRMIGSGTVDLHDVIDGAEHTITVQLQPKGSVIINVTFEDESCLFGLPLKDACSREGKTPPWIVTRCIQEIEARGLDREGLYRVSGNVQLINELKSQFILDPRTARIDAVAVPKISAVAAVLKLYFRELPEPLFTTYLYSSFMQAITSSSNLDFRCSHFAGIIKELPRTNFITVIALFQHLTKVIENEPLNKMNANALATCWGPTLFTPAEPFEDSRQQYAVLEENAVVQFLLEHWQQICDELERGDTIFRPSVVMLENNSSQHSVTSVTTASSAEGNEIPVALNDSILRRNSPRGNKRKVPFRPPPKIDEAHDDAIPVALPSTPSPTNLVPPELIPAVTAAAPTSTAASPAAAAAAAAPAAAAPAVSSSTASGVQINPAGTSPRTFRRNRSGKKNVQSLVEKLEARKSGGSQAPATEADNQTLSLTVFQQFDRSNSGSLSTSELRELCDFMGVKDAAPVQDSEQRFGPDDVQAIITREVQQSRPTKTVSSLMQQWEKRTRRVRHDPQSDRISILWRRFGTPTDNGPVISAGALGDICYRMGFYICDRADSVFASISKTSPSILVRGEFDAWWDMNARPLLHKAYASKKNNTSFLQAMNCFRDLDKEKKGCLSNQAFKEVHSSLLGYGFTQVSETAEAFVQVVTGSAATPVVHFNDFVRWLLEGNHLEFDEPADDSD